MLQLWFPLATREIDACHALLEATKNEGAGNQAELAQLAAEENRLQEQLVNLKKEKSVRGQATRLIESTEMRLADAEKAVKSLEVRLSGCGGGVAIVSARLPFFFAADARAPLNVQADRDKQQKNLKGKVIPVIAKTIAEFSDAQDYIVSVACGWGKGMARAWGS